jgi:hypothetical protein
MLTIFGERFAPECGMSQDYPSRADGKVTEDDGLLMAFRPALGCSRDAAHSVTAGLPQHTCVALATCSI